MHKYEAFVLFLQDLILFTQADRAEQSIDVPRHLHRYIIGTGGTRIREFQAKHHVTVELDKALNKAVVRGAMMDVNQAIEELRQVWFLLFVISIAHFGSRLSTLTKNGLPCLRLQSQSERLND